MTNKELLQQEYIKSYGKLYMHARKYFKGNKQFAEEAVQHLYLNIVKVNEGFVIKSPEAFLMISLINSCRVYYTATKNYDRRLTNYAILLKASGFIEEPSDMILEQCERQEQVAAFANTLKPVQRNVFLGLLEAKSIKEIAEATGSAYNTVKHNRRLIVEKLHNYFNNTLKEEFNYERIAVS